MTTKEARARLKTFGHCRLCSELAELVWFGLVAPWEPILICRDCYQHLYLRLDARYAAMGHPVTAAELADRARRGVVV